MDVTSNSRKPQRTSLHTCILNRGINQYTIKQVDISPYEKEQKHLVKIQIPKLDLRYKKGRNRILIICICTVVLVSLIFGQVLKHCLLTPPLLTNKTKNKRTHKKQAPTNTSTNETSIFINDD